jgi:uncharacterized protein YfdQ (DUF2303 family)
MEKSDIQAAIDAGGAIGANVMSVIDGTGSPFVVIPDGHSVVKLDHTLENPVRTTASVSVTDSNSFINYINKHKDSEATVIYADIDIDGKSAKAKMVCVLNDDSATLPGWGDHTCTFEPKKSVEWDRWIGKDRFVMSQADFAVWLEDNLGDIAGVDGMPSGSEILEMALAFEANASHKLLSKVNLQNGSVQFMFGDEEDSKTRQTMSVFSKFAIGIPVFSGSTSGDLINARLKYREKAGVVSFWYELIRPDLVYRNAVAIDLALIEERTGVLVINGRRSN